MHFERVNMNTIKLIHFHVYGDSGMHPFPANDTNQIRKSNVINNRQKIVCVKYIVQKIDSYHSKELAININKNIFIVLPNATRAPIVSPLYRWQRADALILVQSFRTNSYSKLNCTNARIVDLFRIKCAA